MAYSTSDLILDVLVELNKAEAGQPISDEDRATVNRRLRAVFAELQRQNVITIDPDSIDDDAYNALVKYTAEVIAPAFGRPTDEATKLFHENTLKRIDRINGGANLLLRVDVALQARRRTLSLR